MAPLWWFAFLGMGTFDAIDQPHRSLEAETAEAILAVVLARARAPTAITLLAIAATLALVKNTTALLLPFLEPKPLRVGPPSRPSSGALPSPPRTP